jgi:hypothetical protein
MIKLNIYYTLRQAFEIVVKWNGMLSLAIEYRDTRGVGGQASVALQRHGGWSRPHVKYHAQNHSLIVQKVTYRKMSMFSVALFSLYEVNSC